MIDQYLQGFFYSRQYVDSHDHRPNLSNTNQEMSSSYDMEARTLASTPMYTVVGLFSITNVSMYILMSSTSDWVSSDFTMVFQLKLHVLKLLGHGLTILCCCQGRLLLLLLFLVAVKCKECAYGVLIQPCKCGEK